VDNTRVDEIPTCCDAERAKSIDERENNINIMEYYNIGVFFFSSEKIDFFSFLHGKTVKV